MQHLEGGIIAEVLVKDRDVVKKSQPLVILQETKAKSQVNQLVDQQAILEMRLQRLTAERRLEENFVPKQDKPDVMIATGEQTLFNYLIGPFNQSLRRSFREK